MITDNSNGWKSNICRGENDAMNVARRSEWIKN
jgi:hypothetical protein